MAGSSVESNKKRSFFSVFSQFCTFPKVFGQFKWWFMLKVHKIIRAPHVATFPIVFILFYDRDGLGGVFKIMKNDLFLIFLTIWVSFWAGEGVAYIKIA